MRDFSRQLRDLTRRSPPSRRCSHSPRRRRRSCPPSRFPRDRRPAALPTFIGAPARPRKVQAPRCRRTRSWRRTAAATSTTTPTRPTPTGPGPARPQHGARVDLPAAECASVTFDSAGRIVAVCVGVEHAAPRAARPAHAPPPRLVRPAAAATRARAAQPVHRLLRRRLLLPRPGRPRRVPTNAGTSGSIGETGNPSARRCARARLRPQRGRAARATRSSRRCPTGPGGSGSCPQPAWSARSTRQRRRSARSASASRSATRSRSTRPAACSSSPTAPCTGSTRRAGAPARDLARAVREHRRQEARPDRDGLGHDADAHGLGLRRDHRQRRPDGRRRLQTGQVRAERPARVRRSPCSSRARAPPTSR